MMHLQDRGKQDKLRVNGIVFDLDNHVLLYTFSSGLSCRKCFSGDSSDNTAHTIIQDEQIAYYVTEKNMIV